MKATDRKQALADYRERKVEAGIYAVRCAASAVRGRDPDFSERGGGRPAPAVGGTYIVRAPLSPRPLPFLDAFPPPPTRHWFSLRTGGHPQRALQQAWQDHGEAAFEFEVIERLEEDLSVMARDVQLKQRLTHWLAQLQATRI